MTTLALAKLDEIEQAAATNGPGLWSHDLFRNDKRCPLCTFLALCDPATVAALVRIARAAAAHCNSGWMEPIQQIDALRAAGLIE